jgi:hypothetical protein
LTFADGETSKTINIPINDDSEVESDETLQLTLTNAVNATLGSQDTASVTISDNDTAASQQLAFDTGSYNVSEDGGNATVTVTRSGGSDGEVSVDYATSDDTATAGSDYTSQSGTLTFADGETSKTINIPINDDSEVESDETLQLTLTNAVNATLGSQDTASLTINDNDLATAVSDSVNLQGVDLSNESEVSSQGGPSVTVGNRSIYIGYQQVSSNNQNPVMVSFTNGTQDWVVGSELEETGSDTRGYGLLWDGGDNLYAVFSTDGTQGSTNEDFREFATDGWLTSYGQGGGAKVAIIAKIDPTTGIPTDATFLSAVLSDGDSNTLTVTDLSLNSDGNVVVQAESFFSPRRTDKTAMENNGPDTNSPFDYMIEFTSDLSMAVRAEAPGFQGT